MLAALDALLVSILVGLAWGALESRDLRRAVVLFIAFGLVLALVWARLAAPDVALAEAAIGAGLSGALLIAALRDGPAEAAGDLRDGAAARVATWAVSGLSLALALIVAWALVRAFAQPDPARLADDVAAALDASGVINPVTAILLNFRAYDTLLELAVLLAALLGILALGPERAAYPGAGPALAGLTHGLVPLLLLVSGYLLWVGAHAPGGAFQAGAMLAGAAVMLRLSGRPRAGLPEGATLRLVAVAGVGVFMAVGLALMLAGRPFLGYPPGWAGTLILLIETAATLAIAATLALAFIGGRTAAWQGSGARSGPAASTMPGRTAT
jgi:multisubunit Na+/H+ antiporter MnhB subunit